MTKEEEKKKKKISKSSFYQETGPTSLSQKKIRDGPWKTWPAKDCVEAVTRPAFWFQFISRTGEDWRNPLDFWGIVGTTISEEEGQCCECRIITYELYVRRVKLLQMYNAVIDNSLNID